MDTRSVDYGVFANAVFVPRTAIYSHARGFSVPFGSYTMHDLAVRLVAFRPIGQHVPSCLGRMFQVYH